MFLCSLLKIVFLCGHPYHADFEPFVGQRTRVLVLLKKSKLWPPTLQASTLLTYLTIKNTFTDEMMSFNFARLFLAPAKLWTSLVLKLCFFESMPKLWGTSLLRWKQKQLQKIHSSVTNKKRVRESEKRLIFLVLSFSLFSSEVLWPSFV